MTTRSTHVIVFGNEKGGCGKSTTAMHVIVALAQAGYRVSAIDLDSRQLTLHTYIENRRRWAEQSGLPLAVPDSWAVPRATDFDLRANENREFQFFAEALAKAEADSDFVIIDTPGHDTYLNRLAHSLADTLVSPINDSYIDFDVFGRVNPQTMTVERESCYAEMVREARKQRALVDGGQSRWIVVRNRLSRLGSRNNRNITTSMEVLARQLDFTVAEGMTERVVFREFFPLGLTALDPLEEMTLSVRPNLSHVAARQEIRQLINELGLPIVVPPPARRDPPEQSGGNAPTRDETSATAQAELLARDIDKLVDDLIVDLKRDQRPAPKPAPRRPDTRTAHAPVININGFTTALT